MPGTIALTGEATFPPCACCGMPIRRVWGNLIDLDGTTAYVVQWSPGTKGTHSVVIGLTVPAPMTGCMLRSNAVKKPGRSM